jgi:DNA gyrase subunit A
VTEKGLGKVTDLTEYRVQGRGGKGIITGKLSDKTGGLAALMEVVQDDEIMLITKQGVIIRSAVNEVRNTGRNAQGVKLVNLDAKDFVCAVARVVSEKDESVQGLDDEGPMDPTNDGAGDGLEEDDAAE